MSSLYPSLNDIARSGPENAFSIGCMKGAKDLGMKTANLTIPYLMVSISSRNSKSGESSEREPIGVDDVPDDEDDVLDDVELDVFVLVCVVAAAVDDSIFAVLEDDLSMSPEDGVGKEPWE